MQFAKIEKQITAVVLIGFAVAVVGMAIRLDRSSAKLSENANLLATIPHPVLGFDRNDYPGDDALRALRHTFSFSSYWLNNPPGASANSWLGKRDMLTRNDFGFLVLFNGRASAELKSEAAAARLGVSDANAATAAAKHEGFQEGTVIFLDQEEGGRMLPPQKAYIYAWLDGVKAAGFRGGIYCSAIAVTDGGEEVMTAEDIREHANGRAIVFFVYNDACPPSLGCAYPQIVPKPSASGFALADVWQFAQSPRRKEYTQRCAATYNDVGNCVLAGASGGLYLDLDSANSADPSNGRR
ncbi:MAG TPA: glycoside hydrolase domain-containing protein [Candidatus Acidoferrales bacterium]